MKRTKFVRTSQRLLVLALALFLSVVSASAAATNDQVLYRFQGGSDGSSPSAALVTDSVGNLYGTTTYGGGGPCANAGFVGCGTVFQLTRPAVPGGTWTETVLHRFQGGTDGALPAATLLIDQAGNLYGTTTHGGGGPCAFAGSVGCGTVFLLTPPAVPGGGWTETVLYRFQGGSDGFSPSGLIADPMGNLYGVTGDGGSARCSCGTVFKLTPPAAPSGAWTELVLYRFQGIPVGALTGDGANPLGITFGTGGTLVGATGGGGRFQGGEGGVDFGTIFELVPPSDVGGAWHESVLYRFTMHEQNPVSGVVVDQQGRIYGTTYIEVYQFVSGRTRPLHIFNGSNQSGGYYPYGGVILDGSGNLYGTTLGGGQSTPPYYGVVYQLQRPAQAGLPWSEKILHDFTGSPDGDSPDAPLLFGPQGTLYGTTLRGGNQGCQLDGGVGCGTIFQVVP